jgi:hypothetical protein
MLLRDMPQTTHDSNKSNEKVIEEHLQTKHWKCVLMFQKMTDFSR